MAVYNVSDAKLTTCHEGEPVPQGSMMVRLMSCVRAGCLFYVYSGFHVCVYIIG